MLTLVILVLESPGQEDCCELQNSLGYRDGVTGNKTKHNTMLVLDCGNEMTVSSSPSRSVTAEERCWASSAHRLQGVNDWALPPFSEETIFQESSPTPFQSSQFAFNCTTYLDFKNKYYSKSKCGIKV